MQAQDVTSLHVRTRLNHQLNQWLSKPLEGFIAKPATNNDGSRNMTLWECYIPGPKNSPWQEGFYRLQIDFTNGFPLRQNQRISSAPRCAFKPVIPHPNVYSSGSISLTLLEDENVWRPAISIGQILLAIQRFLKEQPNMKTPNQFNPALLKKTSQEMYLKHVKSYAASHKRPE